MTLIGRAGASPPSLTTCARCLYNNNNNNYIYDRHHTVYFSKCFYALLFHRHLSTFHTMRMRGVYVFDSTCTVLAVYKVYKWIQKTEDELD